MQIETKCNLGDTIYGLIGKPKKPEDVFVIKGIIHKISIFEHCTMYNMTNIALELNKTGKQKNVLPYGFFYENEVDPDSILLDKKIFWFTNKSNCKDFISKCMDMHGSKNKGEKQNG